MILFGGVPVKRTRQPASVRPGVARGSRFEHPKYPNGDYREQRVAFGNGLADGCESPWKAAYYSSADHLSPTGATISPQILADPFIHPKTDAIGSAGGKSRATGRPRLVMTIS